MLWREYFVFESWFNHGRGLLQDFCSTQHRAAASKRRILIFYAEENALDMKEKILTNTYHR